MKLFSKLNKQETISMRMKKIAVVMICTIVGSLAYLSMACAQDFSEINDQKNPPHSDAATDDPAKNDPAAGDPMAGDPANVDPTKPDPATAVQPPPPQPSAASASGDANDEKIKEVMGKDEYKQFVAAKAYAERASTYTLGPTDMIDITVLRHPEVSGQYTINMEGKIQYEFVGDIPMSGYTKDQATQVIAKAISAYIVNPQVTVKIVGYNSKIVYVVGEVGRPGKIFMRGDTISVREALLEAGLPLLSANTKKASMFTPSDNGKVDRRNVDVEDLLYKGDLRQNYVMRPGDTLYLPATFWAKAMRVITPVTTPVGQAATAGRTVVGY
jgi:polysaccharide export outer membrane protein